MGRRLAELGYHPQLLASSSAVRALTTAELIAAEIDYESRLIEIEGQLYGAVPGEILRTVAGWEDDMGCAMLVAHNPGITDLVNHLTDSVISNVPTCGIAVIRAVEGGWSGFFDAGAELLHYDYPRSMED